MKAIARSARILRSALRKSGYDFVRYADVPVRPFDVLRLLVGSRIAAGKSVKFVQIGANDGVRSDPIRELILQYHLPGLLVEPLPDLFASLRLNYAGQPGLAFEQCAIGDADGEATIYRVRPNPEFPTWLQGLASFDKEHLSSRKFGFPGLEQHVESVQVPMLTFPSLLRKHGLQELDFLQVDTEGYDCHIVESAIRTGLRPAIINYEFVHTLPAARAHCKQMLADHGYAFVDVGRDTLAVRDA